MTPRLVREWRAGESESRREREERKKERKKERESERERDTEEGGREGKRERERKKKRERRKEGEKERRTVPRRKKGTWNLKYPRSRAQVPENSGKGEGSSSGPARRGRTQHLSEHIYHLSRYMQAGRRYAQHRCEQEVAHTQKPTCTYLYIQQTCFQARPL